MHRSAAAALLPSLLCLSACLDSPGLEEIALTEECDELSELPCQSKWDGEDLLEVSAMPLDDRIGPAGSEDIHQLLFFKEAGETEAWFAFDGSNGRFLDGTVVVSAWGGDAVHERRGYREKLSPPPRWWRPLAGPG